MENARKAPTGLSLTWRAFPDALPIGTAVRNSELHDTYRSLADWQAQGQTELGEHLADRLRRPGSDPPSTLARSDAVSGQRRACHAAVASILSAFVTNLDMKSGKKYSRRCHACCSLRFRSACAAIMLQY